MNKQHSRGMSDEAPAYALIILFAAVALLPGAAYLLLK